TRALDEGMDVPAFAAAVATRARDALAPAVALGSAHDVVLSPCGIGQLVRIFAASLSARAVRDGRSPLRGRLGERVASDGVTLWDEPACGKLSQVMRFDHEGVPTRAIAPVKDGRLEAFYYDAATAIEEGVEPNGHGVRVHGWSGSVGPGAIHLRLESGAATDDVLLDGDAGAVVLPDPLAGVFTANPATGDFSVTSPYGFRASRGRVEGPLPPLVVAGNVHDILRRVSAVGRVARHVPEGVFPSVRLGGITCTA
ncbi:MAG TPA: metallopeptidase TldD-related protein, partial [Candidatus Thermoplasmatota archaeon]|nr:metallopeptidase TldD-related protein [Candidatus Thermoplasmatota archaeon]